MTPAPRPTLLEQTLSFVPPDPWFPTRVPGYSPPKPLLRFHDTHLDRHLVLKGIWVLPSLLTDILESVDTLFPTDSHSRYSEETFFFDERTYRKLNGSFKGSDVAEVYVKGVARSACQIASSVLIHPDEPMEARTILWTESPQICNEDDPPFFEENIVLRMFDFTEEQLGNFSPDNRKRICSIQENFPIIALGVFLCPNARWCLEEMDQFASPSDSELRVKEFPWTNNSNTTGRPPEPVVVRPPDADHPLWHIPHIPPPEGCEPDGGQTPDDSPSHLNVGDIGPTLGHGPSATMQLIQRAWVNAVRFDTTVIVFDCGNFARVGVRQRETQRLVLSPLIDVCHCEPSWGKFMAGLHLCIIQDCLERWSKLNKPTSPVSSRSSSSSANLKRKADALPDESPKRQRATGKDFREPRRLPGVRLPTTIRSSGPSLWERKRILADLNVDTRNHFQNHPVLTLHLQYGNYNSPTPQILLAPDHPRSDVYKSTQCLPLILTSKLGTGATGQAYAATFGPGHEHFAPPRLVAKIATTKDRLRSLRHEYDVYCYLQSRDVRGIPFVFGYYQDSHRGVGALIMNYVGEPLGRRMDSSKNIKFTASERAALRNILRGIHSKGVLHRDLRSWNVMCSDAGELTLIDLDRADLRASKEQLSEEMERLRRFLKGEFIDKAPIIGSKGLPSDIDQRIRNPLYIPTRE